MKRLLIVVFALALLGSACSGEPETIIQEVPVTVVADVTRIVEAPVTVIVEQEVTRLVEQEVTRVVQMPVTRVVTPTPTVLAAPGEDPGVVFAANYLGEASSNGVTVELLRVLFMQRDVFAPEQSFDDDAEFDGQTYVAEYLVRITNNSDVAIEWFSNDWFARINDRQIALADYLFAARLGESPIEPIFSGSSIITGVWLGTEGIAPDEVTSFTLIIQPARNADGGGDVSERIEITADLSGEHGWAPLPDEIGG